MRSKKKWITSKPYWLNTTHGDEGAKLKTNWSWIDFWSHNYWLYTTDGDEVARFKTIAHHTKPGICTSFQFAISINFAHKNNTAFRVKMDLTSNLNYRPIFELTQLRNILDVQSCEYYLTWNRKPTNSDTCTVVGFLQVK